MFTWLLFMTQALTGSDLLTEAIKNFDSIESYKVTLISRSRDSEEVIKYFYKRPGLVRMEFATPYRGAVLVYEPDKNRVRVRPFGFFKSLVLTFSPDSRFVRSAGGHRVDESDIGTLLRAAKGLSENGSIDVLGVEETGGRETLLVEVRGREGFSVYGINRYLLWLEKEGLLPLKASGFDEEGGLVEEVLMEDLDVDVDFPEGFFSLGGR